MAPLIPILANFATMLVSHLFRDKEDQDEAKAKIGEMVASGQFAAMASQFQNLSKQLDINLIDAKSTDKVQSRWRPIFGYSCSAIILYSFIFRDLIALIVRIWAPNYNLPDLDISEIIVIVSGMLGVSGMRSFDKHGERKLQERKDYGSSGSSN